MRVVARVLLPGLLAVCALAVALPGQALAVTEVPAIEKLVATNCKVSTCGEVEVEPGFFEPKAKVSEKEAETEGFTQAGGRVPFGITDFKVLTVEEGNPSISPGKYPTEVPTSRVTHLRTDVAPGLATNPFAVKRCSLAEFGSQITGTPFFGAPGAECKESVIGENQVTVYGGALGDLALSGTVYDLVPSESEKMANGDKLSSLYGVALEIKKPLAEALSGGLIKTTVYTHTLIDGNVEWGKEARGTNEGDYHDYFEIEVSPTLPLIRSRLTFEGTLGAKDKAGEGDFITNPTSCPGHNTTTLKMTDLEGKEAEPKTFTTPIGLTGCENMLFEPGFTLKPGTAGTAQSDQPDALTVEANEPQVPTKPAQSQVKSASVTLPEGMTLNPSAAKGLEACTPAQARIHSETFGVGCPEGSKLGKVELEVPTLPPGSLTGTAYLGGPESGPITGPPYTMYVVAESVEYGISVRLEAQVMPNESSGQIKAVFSNLPEQPFTSVTMHFERGMLTPLANPLLCTAATATTSFTPFDGEGAASSLSGFTVDADNKGGACSAPVLAVTQSTPESNSTAGAYTSYTLNLKRGDGQQYLTKVSTTLPEGLVGIVPSVTLCEEAQANAGTCSVASRIGTATVEAGAGKEPYSFSGPVYLTGPYQGAPYGLSIVVPTAAGPFNFGNEIVRGTITVNPTTTQLTVTANVPTIKDGIPLRIKGMSVAIEREKFMINPTNCGVLATSTLLNGTPTLPPVAGASQGISTPFQVQNCSALKFTPKFSASTNGKTSRANGASLNVNIGYTAGQANLKYVKTTLPKQLPSRLSTLNKACPVATFNDNPASCPAGSTVGTATAITPVLANPMTGPAMLVSHGGAAFPDLEFVLSGNNVTVIVDGTTNIKNGITTSTFATVPDVPISSFALSLPSGSNSLLAANGSLCTKPLVMPTELEGQNATKVTQNTAISASGCGVVISAHKVKRHTATLTVYVPGAGKATVTGAHLKRVSKKLAHSGKAYTLNVSLSRAGVAVLNRRHKLKVKIQVAFKTSSGSSSKTSVTVTFKR